MFYKGEKVIYIGESWGAWQHGVEAVVAVTLTGNRVELYLPGTGVDNQIFPFEKVVSAVDFVNMRKFT